MKASKNAVQVALAVLAVGSLLVAACAPAAAPAPAPTPKPAVALPAPTPVPTPKPAVTPAEEKPRYGGILKVGLNLDPPGYDPHMYYITGTNYSVPGFFNGVVWYDPKSPREPKIIPDLAEKWEISPDGTVYTFHLNKGVKFHDGAPLTAKDVVFSFNKILKPTKGMPSPRMPALYAVEKAEAPDDYTVKVTLKFPSGAFMTMLADPTILIVPKDYLEKGGYAEGKSALNRKPIGSGPFMFKEAIRGVSIEAVKNPNYFKQGLPYLDGYTIFMIPDNAALMAALRTERIHSIAATQISTPRQEKLLTDSLGDRVVTWRNFTDTSFAVFTLNVKRKPFDDLRVRKAIRLALNNEEMMLFVYEGLGKLHGPIAQDYWVLPKEELQKYPGFEPDYDARLAEAKKLLAEAGYPKGFEMETIGASDRWYNISTMQYGAAALRRIGIEVKLRPQEVGAFNDNLDKGKFDSAGTLHGAISSDPDGVFGSFYTSWGSRNYAKYSNPKIDELYEKQTREMDPVKRREIVWEMQRILLADVAWPMFGTRGQIANRLAVVRGGEVGAGFVLYFNTRYETLWLAE